MQYTADFAMFSLCTYLDGVSLNGIAYYRAVSSGKLEGEAAQYEEADFAVYLQVYKDEEAFSENRPDWTVRINPELGGGSWELHEMVDGYIRALDRVRGWDKYSDIPYYRAYYADKYREEYPYLDYECLDVEFKWLPRDMVEGRKEDEG